MKYAFSLFSEDGQIAPDMESIAGSAVDDTQPLTPENIRSKVIRAIERRELRPESTLKNDWRWQATTAQSSPTEMPSEPAEKATSADLGSTDVSIRPSTSSSERGISEMSQEHL